MEVRHRAVRRGDGETTKKRVGTRRGRAAVSAVSRRLPHDRADVSFLQRHGLRAPPVRGAPQLKAPVALDPVPARERTLAPGKHVLLGRVRRVLFVTRGKVVRRGFRETNREDTHAEPAVAAEERPQEHEPACLVGDFPGAHRAVRPRGVDPRGVCFSLVSVGARPARHAQRPDRAAGSHDALRGDPRVFVFVVCVQRGGGTGNAGTDTRRGRGVRTKRRLFFVVRRRRGVFFRLAAPLDQRLVVAAGDDARLPGVQKRQAGDLVGVLPQHQEPTRVGGSGGGGDRGNPRVRCRLVAFFKKCVFQNVAHVPRVRV